MNLENLGIVDVLGKRTCRPGREYNGRHDNGPFRFREFSPDEVIVIDGHQISLAAIEQCYLREINILWTLADRCDDISYGVLSFMDEHDDVDIIPYPWAEDADDVLGGLSIMALDRIYEIAKMELDIDMLVEATNEAKGVTPDVECGGKNTYLN